MNQFNSLIEAVSYFSSEKVALKYLQETRWENGPICPHCDSEHAYRFSDGKRFKCKACQKQFTATIGTIFESSKISLCKWYVAMYLATAHKKGISSHQLARDISVTQKTAWFMLHRIRFALGIEEAVQIDGTVQLDETFVGGKNKNRHTDKKFSGSQGRSFQDKTPIMGMLRQEVATVHLRDHKVISGEKVIEKVVVSPSFVRLRVVPNTNKESIQPIILENVMPESVIVSDEWIAYRGLEAYFDHRIVDHNIKEYVNANGDTTNALEGFWTCFKRAYHGIYHNMSREHLQFYANEVAFRYNTRRMKSGERLTFAMGRVGHGNLKYKQLISKAA